MKIIRFVLLCAICLTGSEKIFAHSDTLFNENVNFAYFGALQNLDTFMQAGFEVKQTENLGNIKFSYLRNTRPEGWFGTDRIISSVLCIYTEAQWKVFTAYYTQIDSIYLINADGAGNEELAVISSYRPGVYFTSEEWGWQGIDSTLDIFSPDSNSLIFSAQFYYYRRYWTNSEEEQYEGWNFELTCSSTIRIAPGQVRISDYYYDLIGNKEKIDKDILDCTCPENGRYFLRNGVYVKEH